MEILTKEGKRMMRKTKQEKGITLIALVITIIVLLILAGITIITLTGENGILKKSQTASEETNKQTATEIINLKITNAQIKSYAEEEKMPDLQYLANRLCEDGDMAYVKIKNKETASFILPPVQIDSEKDSILTKLKDYPYEFEIDGKLRLASIDGIKVADTSNKVEELENELKNMKDNFENLKNENNALKPNSISTDSLLMTSTCGKNAVNTVNLSSFTNTFTTTFDECFSYNNATGELICKKDGWYIFKLEILLDGIGNTWSQGNLTTEVNNLEIQKIRALLNDGCKRADSSDSLTLFLKNGDNIQFHSKIANASPNIHSATITLFKL